MRRSHSNFPIPQGGQSQGMPLVTVTCGLFLSSQRRKPNTLRFLHMTAATERSVLTNLAPLRSKERGLPSRTRETSVRGGRPARSPGANQSMFLLTPPISLTPSTGSRGIKYRIYFPGMPSPLTGQLPLLKSPRPNAR